MGFFCFKTSEGKTRTVPDKIFGVMFQISSTSFLDVCFEFKVYLGSYSAFEEPAPEVGFLFSRAVTGQAIFNFPSPSRN